MKQKNYAFTKIFRSVFLSYTLSVSILILLYSIVIVPMQKEANLEVMHSEAKTLASSISLICADAMVTEDDSFIIEHNMEVVGKNSNIYEIIISKRRGNYLLTQLNEWRLAEKIPDSVKVLESSQEAYDIIYSGKFGKEVFHYVYPVDISGLDWGWIHISYSLDSYNQRMQATYQSIFILLGALFLATILVSYSIARSITTPILKLRASATQVANGDLSQRVNIIRNDEIGELARDFNTMVSQLENSQKKLRQSHFELEKKVKDRTSKLVEKTKELGILNEQLDIRIKDAVEKNSEQEQLLIQQSRMAAMGEMIGNIAHQWRQPLNALGLVLQNLYYSYEIGELDKEQLERSMAKGKKLTMNMSKTIDDFRNFFKPDKTLETFKISENITNTFELISASFKNHNITFECSLDDTIEVIGYPNEFAQVVLNILTNSKDALISNEIRDAKVRVVSYLQDKNVIVEIADNAGGISESIITKIFDPYFTTKEKDAGTGIGLYMSKMIIEKNMNGFLSAQNDSDGVIFTIKIPIKIKQNA
jgi:two-component system, NtrC family, sensor kinase